ncbi:glycosyltransferase [Sinirhodobacter huangdaonensis]|nr:glycosyltransferase [Sinirhodobacter huangdaonensis]
MSLPPSRLLPLAQAPLLALRLQRLCGLDPEAAARAASWLETAWFWGGEPPELHPWRALCPDPQSLWRLVCLFEPADPRGAAPLHEHLQGGWRRGGRPAPWFDVAGYDTLSARRVAPQEAAILHYAREGWARGLDPDPHGLGLVPPLPRRTIVLTAQSAADLPAIRAHLRRAPPGPDWLVLDTSPDHAVARQLAQEETAALRQGRLRLSPAPADSTGAALAALVADVAQDSGQGGPDPLLLPLPPPQPLPRHPARRPAAAARGPHIALLCPAPDQARAYRWGDFHFAESLAAALEAQGAQAEICLTDAWGALADRPAAQAPEATLLLRGVRSAPRFGSALRLMWMISHPGRVSPEEMAGYDHVFVASESYTRTLRPILHDRVSALLQCSDPSRFAPDTRAPGTDADADADADAIPAHPLLFVGNSRRAERWIVAEAVANGHVPALYGAEWEDTPFAALVQGESLPNRDLGTWYRRAAIVLNDHWPDMAQHGFLSNRLFDVAMAGGFLISDRVEGAEIFGDPLVQVDSGAALDAAIRHYLAHPEERRSRAAALHETVRHQHSFARRATEILARVRMLLARPGASVSPD